MQLGEGKACNHVFINIHEYIYFTRVGGSIILTEMYVLSWPFSSGLPSAWREEAADPEVM